MAPVLMALALLVTAGCAGGDEAPCGRTDRDGDGHAAVECGGDDCDDDDADVHPGASEGGGTFRSRQIEFDEEGCEAVQDLDVVVDEDQVVHVVGTEDFCGETTSLVYLANAAATWAVAYGDDCGQDCRVVTYGTEAATWEMELVFCAGEDSWGGGCATPSIAPRAGGGIEVLYAENYEDDGSWSGSRTIRRLIHREVAEGLWSRRSTVAGFEDVESALVTDATGSVHAVVYDAGGVSHLWVVGGDWRSERVLVPPQVESADVAVDRFGTVGVAFATPSLVGFAQLRQTRWEISTVWTGASWGAPSIGVGSDRVWQIAFGSGDRILLATGAPDSWRTITIDDGVDEVAPSLAVDAGGTARIAYLAVGGSEARVAQVAGGATGSFATAATGADLARVALAVDRVGAAHVVVSGCVTGSGDWEDCGLLYATDAAPPDGIDRDCDGADVPTAPAGCAGADADLDADGHVAFRCAGDDCDDEDPNVHPGAEDAVGDASDRDCDGLDGTDADHDGHASSASGGDDCGDADPQIRPGVDDPDGDCVDQDCDGLGGPLPDDVGNGVDEDCDGVDGTDADGDGHPSLASGGDDCDDGDPDVHPGAPDNPVGWRSEEVGAASSWPAPIAIDGTGTVHVAYELDTADGSGAEVRHARRSADGWEVETVATIGATGAYAALAAVGDDGLALAYRDGAAGELRLARHGAGEWSTETVVGSGRPGLWTALAVAADGSLRLSFSDETSFRAHCASNASGDWSVETVDGPGSAWWTSVAVDAAGASTLAYYDYEAENLVVGTNASGSWSAEAIELAGGRYPTVAIDPAGVTHLVYRELVDGRLQLEYGEDVAGSWELELVDVGEWTPDDFGNGTALALAPPGDSVRIAYIAGGELFVAGRDGREWWSESHAEGVTWPSLAIDGDGYEHVSVVGEAGVMVVTNAPLVDGVDQNCDGADG